MTTPIVKQCPSCHKFWPAQTVTCEFCGAPLHGASTPPKPVVPRSPSSRVRVIDDDVDPELLTHFRPARPVVEAPPVQRDSTDAGIRRVRQNQYAVMRLHAGRMKLRAIIEVIAALMAAFVAMAGFLLLLTGGMSSWNMGIAGGGLVIAYRQGMAAYATLMQRDELLMRIDVAINTAIIAEQLTRSARTPE